jgi:quercetin 2,3-dioxygenase
MPDETPSPNPRDLVVRAGEGEEVDFSHPLNPASELHLRLLASRAGLRRVGLDHVRIPPGRESYLFHRHWAEEEFLFVLAGRGTADVGDASFEIGPGDFLGFPPGTHAHHTRNTGAEELVYLAGGETRAVEVVDFPRHERVLVRTARDATIYPAASGNVVRQGPGTPTPPPRSLLFTASERAAEPEESGGHPLNPRCELHGFRLGTRTGLRRLGVNLVRVPAGKESSILHRHHAEEEFVYVVSGRGVAELGDERVDLGPGDFLGFPAGTLPHNLVATGPEELVVLTGGESRPVEVADFPRAGRRLVKAGGTGTLYPIAGERMGG